ncbi:MAG: hypothetical protein ACYDGR_06155 [Candidatus Dormibacteria bacterium]
MKGRLLMAACAAVAVSALGAAPIATVHASGGTIGFTAPQYVDHDLAGGEPFAIYSPKQNRYVYTSHEGTTHLYRGGFGAGFETFACSLQDVTCYENHVNIWSSADEMKTWTYSNEGATYSGFSDPDLTLDEGGNVYNTGINLANDALFSSPDGGVTWPNGTPQCHEGDRPWLAAGKDGHVWLATDSSTGGNIVTRSTDHGNTCAGSITAGGVGKLYYDHVDGSLVIPQVKGNGIGVAYLADADKAFDAGTGTFVPVTAAAKSDGVYAHWPAIALDSAENLYEVWDTQAYDGSGTGGCNGGPTPLPNKIRLAVGKHIGPGKWKFAPPITIAAPASARVYWPWVQAGNDGSASAVWYQTDQLTDLDCDTYKGNTVNEKTTIYAATILNATSTPQVQVVSASGRVIHTGGVCQGGTTCVATGQDRRLGDFFTNATDRLGCVLVSSGDTMTKDITGGELPTSRPIIMRQNSGPSLLGYDCATGLPLSAATQTSASPAPVTQPSPTTKPPLPNTGAGGLPVLQTLLLLVALAPLVALRRATRS